MNVGIIGVGSGGISHIEAILAAKFFTVVAVCDTEDAMLRATKNNLIPTLIRQCSSVGELLEIKEIELVIVATPDDLHLNPARLALEAGKHVFVEKPLATENEQIRGFAKLAERFPKHLHFSEKYSFADPIQFVVKNPNWEIRLGGFLTGTTMYSMENCDGIMGNGKWRTEMAYNPCAGGLSHNFMVAGILARSPIEWIRATGQVLTYHKLKERGGFDTMHGSLQYQNGKILNWSVCLALPGAGSPYGHRTVSHMFQFEHGSIVYGPENNTVSWQPGMMSDLVMSAVPEPRRNKWPQYNTELFRRMHEDLYFSIREGHVPRHTIHDGINVAYACSMAFVSARHGNDAWVRVPQKGEFVPEGQPSA